MQPSTCAESGPLCWPKLGITGNKLIIKSIESAAAPRNELLQNVEKQWPGEQLWELTRATARTDAA